MGIANATVEIKPIKLNKVIELVFVRIRYTSAKHLHLHCKCNDLFFFIVLEYKGLY